MDTAIVDVALDRAVDQFVLFDHRQPAKLFGDDGRLEVIAGAGQILDRYLAFRKSDLDERLDFFWVHILRLGAGHNVILA